MEININPEYQRKIKRLGTRYNINEHVMINGLLGKHFNDMSKAKFEQQRHHLHVKKFVLDDSEAKKVIWEDFVDYCGIIGVGVPEKHAMYVLGEILIWKKSKGELVIGTDINDIHLTEIEKIAKHFKMTSKFLDISFFQRSPRMFNICFVKHKSTIIF